MVMVILWYFLSPDTEELDYLIWIHTEQKECKDFIWNSLVKYICISNIEDLYAPIVDNQVNLNHLSHVKRNISLLTLEW